MIIVTSSFSLSCFPPTRKRKAGVYKFVRFEERFRKAPFRDGSSVDGRLNAASSNFFENVFVFAFRVKPPFSNSSA